MNLANMTTLRDHLSTLVAEGKEYKFNMGKWLGYRGLRSDARSVAELRAGMEYWDISGPISPYECGTVGCIAGHAALLGEVLKNTPVVAHARKWLGLTEEQAWSLFYGDWHGPGYTPLHTITIHDAIAELSRLIKREEARLARKAAGAVK